MELPKVFQSKNAGVQRYLCLLLSDQHIQAALWQAENGQAQLLENSDLKSYEDLDKAVVGADRALQDLGKESEDVNDVVFGVPPTWVDKGDVVPAKKPLLKKLSEELNLKPAGYVITSEALAERLAMTNPRISALLVEFGQHELFLTLLEQGQLISTKFVGRSGETIADMAEALARVIAHTEREVKLPAKILLISMDLDDTELKEQQQLLLNHDWLSSHPFIQSPTVEILENKLILDAVVGQGHPHEGDETDHVAVAPVVEPAMAMEDESDDSDLAVETPLPTKSDVEPVDAQVASSFGIPINSKNLPTSLEGAKSAPVTASAPEESDDELSLPTKRGKVSLLMMRFLSWFKQHRAFALGGFVAGLLTLWVISWLWLGQTVTAQVKLDMDTKILSQETDLTLDPTTSTTDAENLVLPAQRVNAEVSGNKSFDTTGAKVVGDAATGKVTIYNKTTSPKTFESGTVLSKGSLEFTLNETIEVASASVQISGGSETKEYGKGDVEVTASDIGSDSNLSKDEELQVASFDTGTYSAAVTEGLSGGSSREVRVVSEEDRANLLAELRSELIDQANQEMTDDAGDDVYIVPLNSATTIDSSFSADAGDEVSRLALDLTLKVSALSYKGEDLKPIAQEVLKADLPDGYTLDDSEPQILSAPDDSQSSSSSAQSAVLAVNISSEAKPDIGWDELKNELAGQRLKKVVQRLTELEHVRSVEIELKPSLAHTFHPRLPKDPAKIELL